MIADAKFNGYQPDFASTPLFCCLKTGSNGASYHLGFDTKPRVAVTTKRKRRSETVGSLLQPWALCIGDLEMI